MKKGSYGLKFVTSVLISAKYILFFLILFSPPGMAEALRLTGVTRASHDIQLSLPVEGVVSRILVEEGQRVAAGESLLQLENALQKAEARRREIIKDDTAHIRTLKHNLDIVKSLFENSKALYGETGSISEEEVKKLDMQHATLSGELKALEMQKKRELVEYQAALEDLKRRTLTAPRAGIVSEILVEAGEWATPQQAVVRLVDPEKCYLELHVEERFARAYKAGDTVPVFMPVGSSEQQIEGHVLFVAPIADQASGLVRLKIGFDNNDGEVWPGLSASIEPRQQSASQVAIGDGDVR